MNSNTGFNCVQNTAFHSISITVLLHFLHWIHIPVLYVLFCFSKTCRPLLFFLDLAPWSPEKNKMQLCISTLFVCCDVIEKKAVPATIKDPLCWIFAHKCQLSTVNNNQSEISRETCTFLHDGIHMEWIMFWISQSKFCGHSSPQISTKWVFIASISFPFSLLPLSLCRCAGLAPPFLSPHSFLFLF